MSGIVGSTNLTHLKLAVSGQNTHRLKSVLHLKIAIDLITDKTKQF